MLTVEQLPAANTAHKLSLFELLQSYKMAWKENPTEGSIMLLVRVSRSQRGFKGGKIYYLIAIPFGGNN